ncbi:PREDICTED: thiosulfate sulfurtransferase 18-like isoform X3 [Nicotiana attenuata]|uniref:thiosulfate sulfurtransferase 18-like isoform X3 n=1 Tax=Nicotiana attenuata TaxID=49451 RepID=UPI000905B41B|nr:PREDICTED: thiosulfate sulfurtransferase 18-like isoform X3 [Nicotiana attenuata]
MASHPCSGADPVVTVDVHAARHFLRSGHRYLDVRTEEEFKKGHVENSLNIPYMFNTPQGRVKNPNFLEQVSAACGKEEKLVVGCQSGVRSLHATTDLLIAMLRSRDVLFKTKGCLRFVNSCSVFSFGMLPT